MLKAGDEIYNPRTGQRMRFLKVAGDTDGALLQIECYNSPHGPKEPEHIHPIQESCVSMLSGTLTFNIAGDERNVHAGEVLVVPPGVPHFFSNDDDDEAHYIQEFSPALRTESFFETYFNLARAGRLNAQGMPSLLQLAVLINAFWNEMRVTHPPMLVQKALASMLGPIGRACGYRADVVERSGSKENLYHPE